MSEQGLGASGREEKLAFTGTPKGGGACVPGRGLAGGSADGTRFLFCTLHTGRRRPW